MRIGEDDNIFVVSNKMLGKMFDGKERLMNKDINVGTCIVFQLGELQKTPMCLPTMIEHSGLN